MNKFLSILLSITLSFNFLNAQIDIAVARGMNEGSNVTVEGIVTNGAELGIIRYLQDATGAIAAYPGTGSAADFPDNVQRGDLLQVTGTLKSFNGLLEIDPITAYTVMSSGNPVPDPEVVTPNGINEINEAKLLKINGITFNDGGSVFSVGNYSFSNGSENSEIYIRSNHPIIGTAIPLASVNLTGVSSEFNGLYQLLPRDINDIEIADDFYFTESPHQSDLTNEGFSLNWATNVAGTTAIRYGTTTDMESEIEMGGSTTNHSISLEGLEPAEFYYVQAFSDNGNTTINSSMRYFSTASNSSGSIRVYFNHQVDGSFSNGTYPIATTPAALEAAIINRINGASTSIDVSVYNNNRPTIVAALTEAFNTGIQVRYITDDETGNLALQNPTPPFPVLKGNNGSPLMHNKFFVIDAESENDSWVIMGSTNMTEQNLATDFNNMVIIQDKAIAKAYTIEFEEMWGSDGPNPGIFTIKFGENKSNNTPHLFDVNGMTIESYFSPSDNTSIALSRAIETADDDLQFAMLTFTNNEQGNSVLNVHNAGVSVRGIINNINDNGTEYDYLLSNGVDVRPDNNNAQTHHKYAIIDATNPSSDPQVITGSHNWSGSADTRNDENTLIFHDADIANVFLQEFEARWCEATSGANCITGTSEIEIEGFEVSVFPNPTKDFTNVQMNLESKNDITISLWDLNGSLLQASFLKNVQGDINEEIVLNGLSAGIYLISFKIGDKVLTRRLEVIK